MKTLAVKEFRLAVQERRIQWRKHSIQKCLERGIALAQVVEVMAQGEVIRDYGDDRPFPSALLLGYTGGAPLHVVAAFDESARLAYVITAYVPSDDVFEPDHRTRKHP